MMEERYDDYMARKINETQEDMVNNPSHYNKSGIECIDAIQAMTDEGFEHYLQGNIMKDIDIKMVLRT